MAYYKNDYKPHGLDGGNPLLLIQTVPEIKALNRKINYSKEKADKIVKLFVERKKPYYLKFICLTDIIELDTSVIDQNGKTIFQNLLEFNDMEIFKTYTTYLFRKGYSPTDNDILDHETLFIEKKNNLTENERHQIDKWAFIYFLLRIEKRETAMDVLREERILYAILSLKLDRVLGYGFSNLRQITNNIYSQHPGYGSIYYQAMSSYNQTSKQFEEDKHGKLRNKIFNFLHDTPEQNTQHNELFFELFPELN